MESKHEDNDVMATDKSKDKVAEQNKKTDVPIDRGWAWVVLAGCVVEITIHGGIMRSFGVFFIQFQERFQSSASETALMELILNVSLSIASVFVMSVGLQKFSCRVSVFVGGTLTVTGFLITAFTTKLIVYYFAKGFLCGIGMACIHAPELSIIGTYFKKYRGIANGIFTSGGSIGGLIFAPVVVQLFDTYHYSGAMLIISAMLMHICVGALLMRPIDFYTRRVNNNAYQSGKSELRTCKKEIHSESLEYVEVKEALLNNSDTNNERLKITGNDECLSKTAKQVLTNYEYEVERSDYKPTEKVDYSICLDAERRSFSSMNISTAVNSDANDNSLLDDNILAVHEEHKQTEISCSFILRSVFDLHLLTNPCFVLLLVVTFTFMTGHTVVMNFIPPHVKQLGISNEQIGILISISAAIDLFARISVGFLVDRYILRWSTILAVSGCVLGTCCHLLKYATTFTSIVVLVIVLGICCGQFHNLFGVVYIDVIGVEKFKNSLGFGTLVQGASTATFIPLVGYLRDETGSYLASYHMLGILAYISSVLILIIPIIKRRQDAKSTPNE